MCVSGQMMGDHPTSESDLPVTSVQQLLTRELWCHGCHCCWCVYRWAGGIFSTRSGSGPGCVQIYGGERGHSRACVRRERTGEGGSNGGLVRKGHNLYSRPRRERPEGTRERGKK